MYNYPIMPNGFCVDCANVNSHKPGCKTAEMIDRDNRIAKLEEQVKQLTAEVRALGDRTIGLMRF